MSGTLWRALAHDLRSRCSSDPGPLPDPHPAEPQRHVHQDQLRVLGRLQRQSMRAGHYPRVARGDVVVVEPAGTIDQVQVSTPVVGQDEVEAAPGPQPRHQHPGILRQVQSILTGRAHDLQPPVAAVGRLVLSLLDTGDQAGVAGQVPAPRGRRLDRLRRSAYTKAVTMRASERAYATLLEEIQDGSLAPGAVLAEVEQAARLGVSRTPLREALGRLIADGLVVQQSPRVTVVAPIDADDIRALFEARRALEETAARLAARRGDSDGFRDLAAAFAAAASDLDRPEGLDAYYALIARFDAAVDAAIANDYLAASLRTVRTHLVRVRRMARDNPARLAASVAEHRLIAEAIADGDAELAAHATHVHLHNALTSILGTLSEGRR